MPSPLPQLPTIQQRSCNPKAFFGQANDGCPAAFYAHFPCKQGAADFKQCKSGHHLGCANVSRSREVEPGLR